MTENRVRRDVIRVGADFYKGKGLKAVSVYLPADKHESLRVLAFKSKKSIQLIAREIMVNGISDRESKLKK